MARLRRHGRALLTSAVAATLLSAGLGASPSIGAVRDAEPSHAARISAAEEEPTPAPTPDPTPRPTPWPTPKGVKGLDVSHWNGFPDFDVLYSKGMRFVISKASQGTSFVDDTYRRHTREARQAGLKVGAYHFFDYRRGGIAQARHFLDTVRAATGLGALLPLVVDVETLQSLGIPDKAKARTRLHALLDELYRQTGRYPMIYTSRSMWDRVVGGAPGFGKYPLWVACWKCDDVLLPTGWSGWDFWQVGQFKFGGGLKLDGNVFSGNRDALDARRSRPMVLDNGAEWTSDRTVVADLRGFQGTEVRVAAADQTFGPWQPFKRRFDLRLAARQGAQEVRLQVRSFRGVKSVSFRDSIKLDSVAPAVDGPKLDMRQGARVPKSGTRIPLRARMSASDRTSGLKRAWLKATCDGVTRASRYRSASLIEMPVNLDRRGCAVKAAADDAVGNRATKQRSPDLQLIDVRGSSSKVTLDGDWKTLRNGDAIDKTLARTSKAGGVARMRFDGGQFAIVARRGPAGGRFKVILDGKHIETIDLFSKDGDGRRVVYVRTVPPGPHSLKLKATGTGAKASSGSIVWLDAVLILDRRT